MWTRYATVRLKSIPIWATISPSTTIAATKASSPTKLQWRGWSSRKSRSTRWCTALSKKDCLVTSSVIRLGCQMRTISTLMRSAETLRTKESNLDSNHSIELLKPVCPGEGWSALSTRYRISAKLPAFLDKIELEQTQESGDPTDWKSNWGNCQV